MPLLPLGESVFLEKKLKVKNEKLEKRSEIGIMGVNDESSHNMKKLNSKKMELNYS